jgi:tetratricopeptide (TPR) repeat protein
MEDQEWDTAVDLAASMTNLANRLGRTGHREEALATAQGAVTIFRKLVAEDPVHECNFACALANLSSRLSDLGRAEEALVAAAEATAIHRRLDSRAELAGSLTNLGASLHEMNRSEEALAATEEAVTIFRQLVHDNPSQEGNFARALTNLSNRLSDGGREQEALAAAEEATALHRSRRSGADLAGSLTNLANQLSKAGRTKDALTASAEGVAVYRQMANDDAERYQHRLAYSLWGFAQVRLAAGTELAEALEAASEAAFIFGRLAEELPSVFAWRLKTVYVTIVAAMRSLGYAREATELCRQLVDDANSVAN